MYMYTFYVRTGDILNGRTVRSKLWRVFSAEIGSNSCRRAAFARAGGGNLEFVYIVRTVKRESLSDNL